MELSISLADYCPEVNLIFLKSEIQASALNSPYLKLHNTGKNNGFFAFSWSFFSEEIPSFSLTEPKGGDHISFLRMPVLHLPFL